MSKHPDNKKIMRAFILDFRGRGHDKLRSHIDTCEQCSQYLERLREHTAPASISIEEPGREVLARILDSRAAMTPAPGHFTVPRSLNGRSRSAALAGAVLIVCAALTVLYIKSSGPGEPSILVSEMSGAASLSGRAISPGDVITDGKQLNTMKGSTAAIAFKDHFTVKLAPESRLTIEESRYDALKKRYVLAFNLERGLVHSHFIHTDIPKEYTFVTPQARIDSIGTDFILKTDGSSTTLELNEGTLRLTGLMNGQTIHGTAGRRYEVSDTISSTLLNGRDSVSPQQLPGKEASALSDKPKPPRGKNTPPSLERRDNPRDDRLQRRDLRREQRELMRDEREERKEMRREQREMIRQNRQERPAGRPGR